MKGKAVIPLVVGLCIGLFAVRSGLNAIKSAQGNAASAEKITAIRTMRDIGIGEEIKDDMVELVKTVPNEFIPSMDRVETLEDVLGRVTEKSIPMGGAVLRSMLAPIGTPAGIGGQIPRGFRAFSAQIDEVSAVAYQIKPGDWVDVIVVMDIRSNGKSETISKVLLEHVQVLAMGRTLPRDETSKRNTKTVKSATLLVKEEDVPTLHLAATRGKLALSMRGEDDIPDATDSTGRMTMLQELLGNLTGSKRPPTPDPNPRPAPNPFMNQGMPVSTVVYHTGRDGKVTIERITFENKNSRNVVDTREGPTTGASSMIRGQSGNRRRTSNRGGSNGEE